MIVTNMAIVYSAATMIKIGLLFIPRQRKVQSLKFDKWVGQK